MPLTGNIGRVLKWPEKQRSKQPSTGFVGLWNSRHYNGTPELQYSFMSKLMDSDLTPHPSAVPAKSRGVLAYYYVWLVVKNVIGWGLILASPPIGLVAPGPMGLPL